MQLPAKWLVCAVDLTGLTADEALNRLLAAHELQATQPNTLASGTALEPLPPVSPSPLVSPTPSMLGADLMAQQPSGMQLTSVSSGASPGWPEDPSQSLMPLSWPQSLMQHAQLKESSSLQEDEEIYQAMSQLEQDDKYIAYKSKGKAQHSYIRASSYQDEWVNSVAGRLISFFICLANTRWDQRAQCATKCRRIIPSKRWQKKKDDTHSQLPELSAVPGQLGQAVGCTRSETLMAGLRR